MEFFWDTVETIDRGACSGFSFYDASHLTWLAILVSFSLLTACIYRRSSEPVRQRLRMGFAVSIIADELFKHLVVFVSGVSTLYYLPLQLCYLCVILVIIHGLCFRGSCREGGGRDILQTCMGNFLYLVGLPAGLSAMLFPSWTELPAFANGMSLHSFSTHILLIAYIVMLMAGADIRPSFRTVPVNVMALILMAAGVYAFDLRYGVNYMFLVKISSGSPLAPFQVLGDYRYGYVVILAALILVLYGVPALWRAVSVSIKKSRM